MITKNLYWATMFGRPSKLKQALYSYFFAASYLFRIPIEMLIRKSFGERYFNLLLSITIGVALFVYPYIKLIEPVAMETVFKYFGTWYLYTGYYFYCVFKRWQEVRREPGVFDFAKFSLSAGIIDDRFFSIPKKALPDYPSVRQVETIIEPGAFLVTGAILAYFNQPLGYFLMVCAGVYSLGYLAAYYFGDNFLMDKIDEMICTLDMEETFVTSSPEPRGTRFYAKKPTEKDLRKELLNQIIVEEGSPDDKDGQSEDEENDDNDPDLPDDDDDIVTAK